MAANAAQRPHHHRGGGGGDQTVGPDGPSHTEFQVAHERDETDDARDARGNVHDVQERDVIGASNDGTPVRDHQLWCDQHERQQQQPQRCVDVLPDGGVPDENIPPTDVNTPMTAARIVECHTSTRRFVGSSPA